LGGLELSFSHEGSIYTFPAAYGHLNNDTAADLVAYFETLDAVPVRDIKTDLRRTHAYTLVTPKTVPDDWSFLEDCDIEGVPREGEVCRFVFEIGDGPLNVSAGGSGSDRRRRYTPSDGLPGYALITDRRVVFLIGRERGFRTISVEFGDIDEYRLATAAETHETESGFLFLDTGQAGKTYQFPIADTVADDHLWDADDYLVEDTPLVREQPDGEHHETTTIQSSSATHVTSADRVDGISVPDGISDDLVPAADLLAELRDMNAYSFESLVADLWQLQGWNTTVSEEGSDMGIDVTATQSNPVPQKQLIQAKCYQGGNNIGNSKVQQYASLKQQEEGVDAVVIVTTSAFTASGEDAATRLNVKLVDGDDLCDIVDSLDAYDAVRWHLDSRLDAVSTPTADDGTEADETEGSEDDSTAADTDPIDELRRVRELWEDDIITDEEFESKKAELLDEI
jgi:hypothetical protein